MVWQQVNPPARSVSPVGRPGPRRTPPPRTPPAHAGPMASWAAIADEALSPVRGSGVPVDAPLSSFIEDVSREPGPMTAVYVSREPNNATGLPNAGAAVGSELLTGMSNPVQAVGPELVTVHSRPPSLVNTPPFQNRLPHMASWPPQMSPARSAGQVSISPATSLYAPSSGHATPQNFATPQNIYRPTINEMAAVSQWSPAELIALQMQATDVRRAPGAPPPGTAYNFSTPGQVTLVSL